MAIRLRHDAAAVALPSVTAGSRKYGQQLVLQQQQQKYNAQQAGYDRLLTLGRDAQQNQNQFIRDVRQQTFIDRRDKAQNQFQMGRDKVQQDMLDKEQRARDFAAARTRVDAYAKDAIKDPATPHELRQRIQNLVSGKMTVLSGGYNETEQQEFLDQYNSQLAALLSEMPPKEPTPTAQQQFDKGVVTGPNGMQYRQNSKGDYEPLEQPKKQPRSAQEYYTENEDKFQKDLDATMQALQNEQDLITDPKVKKTPVTPEAAWERMQKQYEFRQKALGMGQPAPKGYGTSSAAYYNVPDPGTPATPGISPDSRLADQARSLGMDLNAPAQVPVNPVPSGLAPDSRLADQARALGVDTNAPAVPRGAPPMPTQTPGQSPINQDIALAPAHPDYKAPPTPTGQKDANGYVIMSDGSKVDPRDSAAMKSGGQIEQSFNRMTNPDGSSVEQSGSGFVNELGSGRPPAVSRFTPKGLTPQESQARQQMLDMPMDQRITSLMPHSSDPLLAGKTIDQALADPEVRKIYDEEIVADAKKRGVKPPEYREAMLAVFDEALTGEVLNGGVSMPQQNYAGMHVDDIKDPKVKAEVAKLPAPKSADERNAIRRGQMYVGPDGLIHTRT